jgi:hypothetical protein
LSLRINFSPKDTDRCIAHIALQVLDRRGDSQHRTHYLPRQEFSKQQPNAVVQEDFLQLSQLRQHRSPYLLNDSLTVVAYLSTEPLSFEQEADAMQERPFNFSSSAGNNIRDYNSPRCRAMSATTSPFASMFSGDLTRFLSGTAFAEVRLAAATSTDPADSHGQHTLLSHASRLTRVSEVLRKQLGPMLKSLPARPHGYGRPEAQPLVLLDAPLPVLRVFHRMLYEASVSVPAAVLAGLLRMALLYDMPELELWVLQQAHAAGEKLTMPSGGCSQCAGVGYCVKEGW